MEDLRLHFKDWVELIPAGPGDQDDDEVFAHSHIYFLSYNFFPLNWSRKPDITLYLWIVAWAKRMLLIKLIYIAPGCHAIISADQQCFKNHLNQSSSPLQPDSSLPCRASCPPSPHATRDPRYLMVWSIWELLQNVSWDQVVDRVRYPYGMFAQLPEDSAMGQCGSVKT